MNIKDTLKPGLTIITGGLGSIIIGSVSKLPDSVSIHLVGIGFIVTALGFVVVVYPMFMDE